MSNTENKYVNPISTEAKQAIIDASVQALPNKPTLNATEMKKRFVSPIINGGDEPSLADEVDRIANEANKQFEYLDVVIAEANAAIEGLSNEKGHPNGIATLDENGKIPESQIPDVITASEVREIVEEEISEFDFVKVVDKLPAKGLPNREYFLRKETATDSNDLFDEYAWINRGTDESPDWGWEFKGTKKLEVDFTDYVKKEASIAPNKAPYVYTNDENRKHYLASNTSDYVAYNIPMIYGVSAGETAPNGYLITQVPANPYHSANKKYVDEEVQKAVSQINQSLGKDWELINEATIDANSNSIDIYFETDKNGNPFKLKKVKAILLTDTTNGTAYTGVNSVITFKWKSTPTTWQRGIYVSSLPTSVNKYGKAVFDVEIVDGVAYASAVGSNNMSSHSDAECSTSAMAYGNLGVEITTEWLEEVGVRSYGGSFTEGTKVLIYGMRAESGSGSSGSSGSSGAKLYRHEIYQEDEGWGQDNTTIAISLRKTPYTTMKEVSQSFQSGEILSMFTCDLKVLYCNGYSAYVIEGDFIHEHSLYACPLKTDTVTEL